MIQRYDLLKSLHDIPNPHDCVIQSIFQDKDCIVFAFEDQITNHDSVKYYCPSAKSLVIRYHLPEMDYALYQHKTKRKLRGAASAYISMPKEALFHLTEDRYKLEYLYHYIYYGSMILVLSSGRELRLELPDVDCVTYEWIE